MVVALGVALVAGGIAFVSSSKAAPLPASEIDNLATALSRMPTADAPGADAGPRPQGARRAYSAAAGAVLTTVFARAGSDAQMQSATTTALQRAGWAPVDTGVSPVPDAGRVYTMAGSLLQVRYVDGDGYADTVYVLESAAGGS